MSIDQVMLLVLRGRVGEKSKRCRVQADGLSGSFYLVLYDSDPCLGLVDALRDW
jgi:hypothetical protein